MIRTATRLFTEFVRSEESSGIILIACTAGSLLLANSPLGAGFLEFCHHKVGFESEGWALKLSIEHWVNDGLMTLFFLMVGLEIERELYEGELSDLKDAALPVLAAVGGMLAPALLHFAINRGAVTQPGWGIPMATDIAFALGVLALLGPRVPLALKVFLAALAIIDDLGAIVVIALFYAQELSLIYLALALAIFAGLLVLNRACVTSLPLYLVPGLIMWYCMLRSGIHATIAGVLLAFAIPFCGGENSPSHRLLHFLHRPVAFGVVPLFVLVNTGVVLRADLLTGLATANSLGIIAGLFLGKPLGVCLASWLAVRTGLAQLPRELTWRHVVGAGFLSGIGFTMSIFITLLAFAEPAIIEQTKVAILLASLLAGIAGFFLLKKAGTAT
jgi:NhaA family Na+:H+ antiporter